MRTTLLFSRICNCNSFSVIVPALIASSDPGSGNFSTVSGEWAMAHSLLEMRVFKAAIARRLYRSRRIIHAAQCVTAWGVGDGNRDGGDDETDKSANSDAMLCGGELVVRSDSGRRCREMVYAAPWPLPDVPRHR